MAGVKEEIFQVNPEILHEFLKFIELKDLLALLESWGSKKPQLEETKLDTLLKAVGSLLTLPQLEDLWLLREKGVVFKSRNWIFFQFNDNPHKIKTSQDLEQKCQEYLKIHNLEFNNTVRCFKLGEEIYFTLIFKGESRIIEEEVFQYKLIRPIQRIRCLINLGKGFLKINGRSIYKIKICLTMLEEILGVKLKKLTVPSYKIGDFVKEEKPITKLKVSCPQIVGGFSGIEKIILEGPNVIDGLYNLQARQEVKFNFEGLQKIGPFSLAQSTTARLNNQGEIQISDEKQQDRLLKLLQD
ncbi:MAG TPA: hypothetical protein VMV49_14325 [Candidatus Deferrimicrobium sp.]|nr:hypothetical protein [Candidatus Deferrimicrobium sp.]